MKVRTHAVAKAAYECVARRRDEKSKQDKEKHGALAHKLPGMILENGLAQATGFLLAKGTPEHSEHRALLDDLSVILRAAETTTAGDGSHLHQEVIDSDVDRTLMLTRRSLEAAGWLKRYAQGVLRVDATGTRAADDESSAGEQQRWPRS